MLENSSRFGEEFELSRLAVLETFVALWLLVLEQHSLVVVVTLGESHLTGGEGAAFFLPNLEDGVRVRVGGGCVRGEGGVLVGVEGGVCVRLYGALVRTGVVATGGVNVVEDLRGVRD